MILPNIWENKTCSKPPTSDTNIRQQGNALSSSEACPTIIKFIQIVWSLRSLRSIWSLRSLRSLRWSNPGPFVFAQSFATLLCRPDRFTASRLRLKLSPRLGPSRSRENHAFCFWEKAMDFTMHVICIHIYIYMYICTYIYIYIYMYYILYTHI